YSLVPRLRPAIPGHSISSGWTSWRPSSRRCWSPWSQAFARPSPNGSSGSCGRQVLVQRPVDHGGSGHRLGPHPGRPREVLPPSAILLPRKGGERAAAVVRALGPGLGSKARRLGACGARSRAARRPGPHVSAPVHGETLPGASTTGGAAQPTLLVLASRV